MRRVISTRVHGWLDYTLGPFMGLTPFLFGFRRNRKAAAVPIAYSGLSFVYSLFTDYELGAVRKLPMKAHLTLDTVGGAFMLVSPWLLGFARDVKWPHVALGAIELSAVGMSQTVPRDRTLGGRLQAAQSDRLARGAGLEPAAEEVARGKRWHVEERGEGWARLRADEP